MDYDMRKLHFENEIDSMKVSADLKKGLKVVNENLCKYSKRINSNRIKSKVSFYYVFNGLLYAERCKLTKIITKMFKLYDLCNGETKEIDVSDENPVSVMLDDIDDYDFWEVDFTGYNNEEFYDDFIALIKKMCRDEIKCVFIYTDEELLSDSFTKIESETNSYKECKYQYDYVFQINDKSGVYDELEDNFKKNGFKCNFDINDITNIQEYRDNEIYIENALIKKSIIMDNDNLSFKDLDLQQNNKNIKMTLQDMIGLKNVKEEFENLKNLLKFYKDIGKSSNVYLNTIFKGNPGTGKTTVARFYADLLYKLGYIKNNNLVEIVPTDLMGEYVGQTRETTREILNKAKGGVLFIDEAYNLNTAKEYSGGTYMREAVVELLKYMEDKSNVVIFAGYKNEMEELMDINPGFKSRIGSIINFEDYTTQELIEIFKLNADKYNLKLGRDFIKALEVHVEKIKNSKNFGNARYIEALLNKILFVHASNVYNKNSDLYLLTADDLKIKEEKSNSFGFSINKE